MAYRDYIHCADCDCKLIYDGNDNAREWLEECYGDTSAGIWTAEIVCPDCLKKLRAKLSAAPKVEQEPIPQEWKDAVEKAIDAMQKLTPAIDAALWIGLMWNDHNHDTDAIIYKAEQAAKGLGLVRGGPDSRDTLFEGWNSAIAALRELVKE